MADKATKPGPKAVLDLPLAHVKETKGTHVLGNSDSGVQIYVPKPFFVAAGVEDAPSKKYRIIVSTAE